MRRITTRNSMYMTDLAKEVEEFCENHYIIKLHFYYESSQHCCMIEWDDQKG